MAGGQYYLSLPARPTAIVCFNDLMAIGLMHSLQESGLVIPRDISVTGFDDISLSAYTSPPLTTFHQPKKEIGAAAARMLLEMVAPSDDELLKEPQILMMRGNLLIRGTTASPQ